MDFEPDRALYLLRKLEVHAIECAAIAANEGLGGNEVDGVLEEVRTYLAIGEAIEVAESFRRLIDVAAGLEAPPEDTSASVARALVFEAMRNLRDAGVRLTGSRENWEECLRFHARTDFHDYSFESALAVAERELERLDRAERDRLRPYVQASQAAIDATMEKALAGEIPGLVRSTEVVTRDGVFPDLDSSIQRAIENREGGTGGTSL